MNELKNWIQEMKGMYQEVDKKKLSKAERDNNEGIIFAFTLVLQKIEILSENEKG